jgi:hypothetical protein
MSEDQMIQLALTNAQALVLFEWLVRSAKTLETTFEDSAEQRVLWDIEAILERSLVAPFAPNYTTLLAAARDLVRDADVHDRST